MKKAANLCLASVVCLAANAVGESSKQADQEKNAPSFREIERKMINDCLVISLQSGVALSSLAQDDMRHAAHDVVQKNPGHYMVRVFFYDKDQSPSTGESKCRYEWTKKDGLTLSFDRSRPKAPGAPVKKGEVPEYRVLSEMTSTTDDRIGFILLPSITPKTPGKEIEKIGHLILDAKGFDQIYMYSTEDAYRADSSASYSQKHPGAIKNGRLGSITKTGQLEK